MELKGEATSISAAELVTKFLTHIHAMAESILGKELRFAVLSVPASLTEEQRERLGAACESANLQVLQFVNAPVAAVLGYGASKNAVAQTNTRDQSVVLDIGSNVSVSLVRELNGLYQVCAALAAFVEPFL